MKTDGNIVHRSMKHENVLQWMASVQDDRVYGRIPPDVGQHRPYDRPGLVVEMSSINLARHVGPHVSLLVSYQRGRCAL